jgi:polyferredoxin
MLILVLTVAGLFLAWMGYLSATRIFFVEDASIYWSEILVIILLVLVWKMRQWDRKLRRLRVLSFWIIVAAAVAALRITSPVHFGFSKVYDPASVLATAMVFLAALAVPHVWCRYLCPWREAIAWAAKYSIRKLHTDFEKCVHCGKCTEACAVEAVEEGRIDPRECHMCLRCVDVCPTKAITIRDQWRPGACETDCSSCSQSH